MGCYWPAGQHQTDITPPKILDLTDDFCFPVSYLTYRVSRRRDRGERIATRNPLVRSFLHDCAARRVATPLLLLHSRVRVYFSFINFVSHRTGKKIETAQKNIKSKFLKRYSPTSQIDKTEKKYNEIDKTWLGRTKFVRVNVQANKQIVRLLR